ncbi:MAG: SDR family NAD(P)-dependent oxidoreductase [Pseudomonadota bacterium]
MADLHPVLGAGKTAVVTGSASGIGRAAAERFAGFGMRVVMVDLPGEALDEAVAQIEGAEAAGISVADTAGMVALADRIGPIDLLMNNAASWVGKGFGAPVAEWRQAMDVNFWAAVEGVEAFLPAMRSTGRPAVIVNVGSKQGITNPPGHPIYNVTKSALKSYTELLQHHLREEGAAVTAHLLIPGWTTTGRRDHHPGAWLPNQVVDVLVEGVTRGDFYLLCQDNEVTVDMDRKRILWAAGDIIENRPPLSRWHPEHREAAAKACS